MTGTALSMTLRGWAASTFGQTYSSSRLRTACRANQAKRGDNEMGPLEVRRIRSAKENP